MGLGIGIWQRSLQKGKVDARLGRKHDTKANDEPEMEKQQKKPRALFDDFVGLDFTG